MIRDLIGDVMGGGRWLVSTATHSPLSVSDCVDPKRVGVSVTAGNTIVILMTHTLLNKTR